MILFVHEVCQKSKLILLGYCLKNGCSGNMKNLINNFLNKPVKYKLTMMVMAITFTSLTLTCLAFIKYDIDSTKQSMIDELKLVGDIIGKRTAPGMQFIGKENKEKAEENLADLQSKKSVVLACIYKKDGALLAKYGQDNSMTCPVELPKTGSYFINNYLAIYQDINAIGDKTVGSIYIQSDMREIDQHIIQILIGMLVLMAAILSIAFILTQKIQKVISMPVKHLTDTAQEITKSKNYSSRAPRFFNDELGILSDAFNTMLTVVHESDIALKHANEHLEEKVEARTAELNHALQSKSNFLSNMSHEIRTPNHAVMNSSKYVESDLQDILVVLEEYKNSPNNIEVAIEKLFNLAKRGLKSATRIRDASNRQGHLLNNILDLSKLGEGKMEMDVKSNDLKMVIQNVITESEGLFKGGSKKLEVVFVEPVIDTKAEFDFLRMTQVISNLLGNAIKYSEQGTITISLSHSPLELKDKTQVPGMLCSISDEGIGIPPGELESVFEKFTESSNTKKQSGGTGIGLAICHEIISLHLGKIWAEHNKDKGSAFIFVIPLKKVILKEES